MELDINNLISFFKKNTKSPEKVEFTEQEAAGASSAGSGGKTPRKWSSNRKFGKTYMNDPKYVWKSDLVRGPANQLFYDA
jgi:hypothetical protein